MSRSLKARRAVNGHAALAVIAWIEHQLADWLRTSR